MGKKKFTWSEIDYGEKDIHHYAYYGKEELGHINMCFEWKKWVWEQNEDIIMSLSCIEEVAKKLKELEE